MPMDLQALMMPVSDDEQMKALAQSLRGRQTAADFFSASSIPNLQKMAQSEQEYIQNVGARQGVLREALERRKQDQAQRDEYMQFQRDVQGWREGDAEKDRVLQLALAAMKAGGDGGYARPQTRLEREDFDKGDRDAVGIMTLLSTFKPEYASEVPLTGKMKNFIGRRLEVVAPEAYKEQAKWWGSYTALTMEQLHEMFGSALTKHELARWEAATITPHDGQEYIKEKLAEQAELVMTWTERKAALALNRGYDPNEVLMNFGTSVNVPALQERISDGSYFKDLAERQAGGGFLLEDLPPTQPGTAAVSGLTEEEEFQEGDIIENDEGHQMVLRGGEWVPL